MHIAILIDEHRLSQEQAMLNRLCIGLTGEGVKVTRVVPESLSAPHLAAGEERMALLPRIGVPFRVLPWMRAGRLQRLVESLEDTPPDAVMAVGSDAWPLAMELGQAVGRPVALEVWSTGQVGLMPKAHAGRCPTALAACLTIAEAVSNRRASASVQVVPMGIAPHEHTSPHRFARTESEEQTIAVIGTARDMPAYQAVLSGLARIVREKPGTQIFIELHGPHEHDIWRYARRLELLGAMSAIADASQYHQLLAECDLMLLPERFGCMRTIMLEAMAAGALIVCNHESALDPLVHNETAVLVSKSEPEIWTQQVLRLLNEPAEAQSIRTRARAIIHERHRSSTQVSSLIAACESMLSARQSQGLGAST